MMSVKQIAVRQDAKKLVTWVEGDSRLKPGVRIELKGENGLWTVEKVYQSTLEKSMIQHSWNVGGL
jgi:hypothetical protein